MNTKAPGYEAKQEFLLAELERQISVWNRFAGVYMRWTFGLRFTTLLLSATSTLVLGWNTISPQYATISRNIALSIGALMTVVAGISAFWNVETYWMRHQVVRFRLRALWREIQFATVGGRVMTEAELHKFFRRYQKIVSWKQRYWETVTSRASEAQSPKDGGDSA